MFVSVLFVRGILAELHHQGLSTPEILRGLNVSDDVLSDLRARIPCGDLERIIGRALQLSKDQGLGLTMGSRAPESMLQLLGYLLLSCRTLREAFGALQRYAALTVNDVGWGLVEEGDLATFSYRCPLPHGLGSRFAAEYVLAMTLRIARHFVPVHDAPVERVLFRHEVPAYEDRYARVFQCPVEFGQPLDGVVFSGEG